MHSGCVFEKSKYYQRAVADALKIVQPLGSSFLERKQKRTFEIVKGGTLTYKYVCDKPIFNYITGKKTPIQKLEEFFQLSDLQRKSHYVSSSISDFLEKQTNVELINMMINHFMPNIKPQHATIELTQLLFNPGIDSLYYIEDYALSEFFFVYEGGFGGKIDYLYDFFDRRILEYEVQTLHIERNIKTPETHLCKRIQKYKPVDIENKDQIQELIQGINNHCLAKDPLYCGVHFYYGDCTEQIDKSLNIFDREISNIKMLQYYVTLITGILAEGHRAILKLNGCFRQKTSEYIFLLKLAFNDKLTLIKPIGSNPYNSECYLICENFNKANGRRVHEYLMNNYECFKIYGEDKLLLNSKKIFREGVFDIIRTFNDRVLKNIQIFVKEFKNNPNLELYPYRSKILEKVSKTYCIYDELVEMVNEIYPAEQLFENGEEKEKKKEEKKDNKIIEKDGDTSLLSIFAKPLGNQKKQKKKEESVKKEEKKQHGKNNVDYILQEMEKRKEMKKKDKKSKKKRQS